MKFKIVVAAKENPEKTWEETYDENVDCPERYGRDAVDYFNRTLRAGEKQRVFISAYVLDHDSIEKHSWRKTNLSTTIDSKGKYCDFYECTNCGITGRTYILGESVRFDARYAKAKVYRRCDTSKLHIEKLRNMKS